MSKSANTSLRFQYQVDLSSPYLNFADWDGEYQDLIMWGQLVLETCCAGHPSCRRGRGIRLKLLHHFKVKLREVVFQIENRQKEIEKTCNVLLPYHPITC
ncbi:hypothetical protein JG688_00010880 [Phytophthora aleatoria]|uniref:Uncharacterized protein n=1 Tax=Phytophthora aleatoria TaxID=2496075 RepID=A0A8J5MFA9_9STRA|nr:hypothetical protein JG688_00010880 [Phytophthora aleatoria]